MSDARRDTLHRTNAVSVLTCGPDIMLLGEQCPGGRRRECGQDATTVCVVATQMLATTARRHR